MFGDANLYSFEGGEAVKQGFADTATYVLEQL